MSDRRRERRYEVSTPAEIVLNSRGSVTCTVRDISSGGARLSVVDPERLPAEFRLRILTAELMVPSVVAWKTAKEVGVWFTGVATVGSVDDSPLRMSAAPGGGGNSWSNQPPLVHGASA